VAALFGGLAGWLVYVTARAFDAQPPVVPWPGPLGLLLLAAVVGVLAYNTHQHLQVRRERMEPQRAVAYLVLGKTAALGGAVVAGGYLIYGLMFVNRLSAEAPRDRVIHSAVAVVAGIGMCVAGLLLERACKVPGGGDDDGGTDRSDA
jgi:hypothetical protein